MRLYSAKIPIIARDIIRELTEQNQIEVSNPAEAELDIQAVLKEYLRTERTLTEETKDVMERRGLSHGTFGKLKHAMAEEKGFGLGEDGVTWMINQILETFMQSKFVDEIFASDADLRKQMRLIFKRHMMVDEELDVEVRRQIKNLEEGTAAWDVEYSKVMGQIRNKRGLKE